MKNYFYKRSGWLLAFVFILLIIIFSLFICIHAVSSQKFVKAFYQALNRDNYSILEPFLSPTMKKAFNEGSFQSLVKKLRGYGDTYGYKIIGEEDKGNYHIIYMGIYFEKTILTFKLVINKSTGLLDGLWITEVKDKGVSLLNVFIYTFFGGLAGLLSIYIYLKKMDWSAIIFGLVLLLLALFVQSPLQQVPFILAGIRSNADLIQLGETWIIIASIWLGFVAGLVQELVKYYASRNKTLRESSYIGAGFGFSEAIIIPVLVYAAYRYGTAPAQFASNFLFLAFVERFLALLFHTSTTIAYAHYYKQGVGGKMLLSLLLLHTLIDSLGSYYQLTLNLLAAITSYIILLIPTIFLLYRILPLAKREPPFEPGPQW